MAYNPPVTGPRKLQACAKHGTHYCDLTGEAPFVRESMRTNDEAAKASGARILHCCGYDSIPSDLATLMAVDHMKAVEGKGTARVDALQAGVQYVAVSKDTRHCLVSQCGAARSAQLALTEWSHLDYPAALTHSSGLVLGYDRKCMLPGVCVSAIAQYHSDTLNENVHVGSADV